MPALASQCFCWSAIKFTAGPAVVDGQRARARWQFFATCCVNCNKPGIGHDLLKVLAHNAIPDVIVEKESCCGMPKLELGDLKAVEKHKIANIPVLAR